MATTQILELKMSGGGQTKTVSINDADDASNVTKAKVNAFVTQYNNVYETDYELVNAVMAVTTKTTLSLS